jgi:hypothetical protein
VRARPIPLRRCDCAQHRPRSNGNRFEHCGPGPTRTPAALEERHRGHSVPQGHEHPDAPHPLTLLCAHYNWPSRRAPEPRDELPPSHSRSPCADCGAAYRGAGCKGTGRRPRPRGLAPLPLCLRWRGPARRAGRPLVSFDAARCPAWTARPAGRHRRQARCAYSITLSAVAGSVSGMVRPRALAVLRLRIVSPAAK